VKGVHICASNNIFHLNDVVFFVCYDIFVYNFVVYLNCFMQIDENQDKLENYDWNAISCFASAPAIFQ
jgi:hypothetical protein